MAELFSTGRTSIAKHVITDYTYALDTLDKYDYQQLEVEATTRKNVFRATNESAVEAIHLLQQKFGGSDLFGNEKDQSFKSSINTIYQTFDGEELYPSIEEKAAMLFYLVVKNHSFSDGNKRIAAFLFLWFLENNSILYKKNGSRLIGNNTKTIKPPTHSPLRNAGKLPSPAASRHNARNGIYSPYCYEPSSQTSRRNKPRKDSPHRCAWSG